MTILKRMGARLRFSSRVVLETWVPIGVWSVLLLLVEVLGRSTTNDFVDLGLALMILVWTTAIHSARPLPPLSWMGKTLRRLHRQLFPSLQIGADLRGSPQIARRTPRKIQLVIVVLVACNAVVFTRLPQFPSGFREFLSGHFYLGYLTLISLLWSAMILLGLFLMIIAWASIHDLFVMSYRGQGRRPRNREYLTLSTVAVATLAAAFMLPISVPVIFVCMAAILSASSLIVTSSGLELLWRTEQNETIHSMDGRWYLLGAIASFFLATLLVMQLATGESLVHGAPALAASGTPVTLLLGKVFNWIALPGSVMATYHVLRFAWMGIDFNPERDQIRHQRTFRGDNRQWEIQQRRSLVRGLQTLFKRKARLNPTDGTGIWIGLQHWFVLGMSRDVDQEDPEATSLDHVIGPPYYKLFHRETRLHYWQITRALEIDLILVEDGVTFRRFTRVLRMMFEIFDIYGGTQRAEEMHFKGLPGVHVVIHSFTVGEEQALQLTDYPEPDYDDIARARVLHVFKDRQESEELDFTPDESRGAPVLSGV